MAAAETRPAIPIWVVHFETQELLKTNGFAVNTKYAENPGPDEALWVPSIGYTIGRSDFAMTEDEGRVLQRTLIRKKLAWHADEIERLERLLKEVQ